MGHLVNPIAFRVGWSRHWLDDYFAELTFYPEILHRLLRFRYFLNCFFSNRVPPFLFEYFVVSHFRFTFDLKGFFLELFYYNSRMDLTWYELWDKLATLPYGIRFFPKERTDPPPFASHVRKAFSLLFSMYHFSVKGVFDEVYRNRLGFFKALQESSQAPDFVSSYRSRRLWKGTTWSNSERECYDIIRTMRCRAMQEPGRINYAFPGYTVRIVNYEHAAHMFYRALFLTIITIPYLRIMARWIIFLAEGFFLKQPLTIGFFQINNDQVSARFVAMFIAHRLSQGFGVKTILRPIRRDLRFSKKLATRAHYKERGMVRTEFRRSGLGTMHSFSPLLLVSNKFIQKLEYVRQHIPSFDQFLLAFRRRGLLESKYRRVYRRRYYRLLRLFFERRISWTFMYYLTGHVKRMFFFMGSFFTFFFEMVFARRLSYFVGRDAFRRSSLEEFQRYISITLYSLTGAVLLSFLNFSVQSSASPRSFDTYFGVKRRTFRFMKSQALGIQGLRVRLHGRFTRKQIAASFHFKDGAMPRSSMDASVDYAFTTTPLRNSAVGVKVWLYRQGCPEEFDYAIIFDRET